MRIWDEVRLGLICGWVWDRNMNRKKRGGGGCDDESARVRIRAY